MEPTKYALVLNDMREPNVENLRSVRFATDRQELMDWYNSQLQSWVDGPWHKAFRQGSELEWFNPADLVVLNEYWGGIWVVPANVEDFQLTKAR